MKVDYNDITLAIATQMNQRLNIATAVLAGMVSFSGPSNARAGRHSVEEDVTRALAYADELLKQATIRDVAAHPALGMPYGKDQS